MTCSHGRSHGNHRRFLRPCGSKRPKAERSSTARRGKSNHRKAHARLLPTPSLGIPKGDATSGTQEGEDSPCRSPLPCRGGAGGGVSNFKSRVGIFLTPPPTPPLIGVGRTAENAATQLPSHALGIPKGDATSGTQEGEGSPYRSPLPCRGGAGGGVSNFKSRVGIFLTPPPTPPLIGVGRTAENTATPLPTLFKGRGYLPQLPTPIRGGAGGGVKGRGK